MIKQPITLLELGRDIWMSDFADPAQLPLMATVLNREINKPEVREWIEASPLSELDYTRLRWVLMLLRGSKVAPARRLTWRERITGRLSQ